MLLDIIAHGYLHASFWEIVLLAFLMTHVTIVAITVYLHRHQAHRALELHPMVSHFFRLWLWMSTGMVTKEWVAIHRKHHAKCETPEDPHSPQIYGIKKVLLEGAELYRAESHNADTMTTYGKGTPDDWLESAIYTGRRDRGIKIMLLIDVLLFGVAGIAVWGVQMIWSPVWAAGVINGLGHWWGYRHYEVPDASTNIFPIGILIGGEEFHNNHHTYPNSAKLSSRWWEFDIGWFYIRLLSLVKLAAVKKVAPTPLLVAGKTAVDLDTVRAIVVNRFQIMYRYRKDVIARVVKDEMAKADESLRTLIGKAKKLLVREESLLDEEARAKLQSVINTNDTLNTIYLFKQQLQELWQRSTSSQETMLHALQDWCRRAQETRIKALEEFAHGLSSYTLRPA